MENITTPAERERDAEQLVRDGLYDLRRAYYQDIRDTAEDIAERYYAGEFSDLDDLTEDIDQTADSTAWVIYMFKAQIVLMVSDNDSDGVDQLGADGFDWSAGIPWSQLAYFAYRQDLTDQLDAELGDSLQNDDTEWGARLEKLGRERLVELVESVGAAAFDDESNEDLIGCIRDSVKAGDIDTSDI